MEFTGKAISVVQDYNTDKFHITFEVNESYVVRNEYDKIKNLDKLRINAVKYTEKRSLDANAYFHVLVGKIADSLNISKARCKNVLICRYGQPELIEDGTPAVIKSNIPISWMLEQELLHCQACGAKIENDMEIIFYKVYRGSHTYDTKEMSILIDGAVQEAKELGIETMTPEELERMKSTWQISGKAS